MRSHNDEHADSLPVIDILALRHSAYIFDALIYYMRTTPEADVDPLKDGISVISWQDTDDNDNEEQEDDIVNASIHMETESLEGETEGAGTGKVGRKHAFFQRSDSTIFLGCPPPDPFHTPLVEALPLADQPHLLQPSSRREDLFRIVRPTVFPRSSEGQEGGSSGTVHKLPLNLSLSTRAEDSRGELVGGLRSASYQGLQSRIRNQSADHMTPRLEPLTSRLDPAPRLDLSSNAAPQSAAINLSLSATSGSSNRVSESSPFLALSQPVSSSSARSSSVDMVLGESRLSTTHPGTGESSAMQPSASGVIVEMSATSQSLPSSSSLPLIRDTLRPSATAASTAEGGQRSRSPCEAGRSDVLQPSVIVHTASSSLPLSQPSAGRLCRCVVAVCVVALIVS